MPLMKSHVNDWSRSAAFPDRIFHQLLAGQSGGMTRCRVAFSLLLSAALLLSNPWAAAQTSQTERRLAAILERYPAADANGDGVLTEAEARSFREGLQGQRGNEAAAVPPGAACRTEMVAMRDGVRLATEVCLPSGDGPWAAILIRTPYGRKAQVGRSANYLNKDYAFVAQDWRGLFDSEGKFTSETMAGTVNSEDGYDTVEWIAGQNWSNGKVGITGGSGPGIAAKQAVLANPPHLIAAYTSVASMFPRDYAYYHGGVPQSQGDRWSEQRGVEVRSWPKPRSARFDRSRSPGPGDHRGEAAPCGRIALLDHGGWFDIFSPSVLSDFMAIGGRNNRAVMAAKGHGPDLKGLHFPAQNLAGATQLEWFDYWLKGKDTAVMNTPPIRYFLMGDTMRPGAPGNVWKQADSWPIPSTPLSFYLGGDGKLSPAKPTIREASVAYAYDPRDPVPTVGGANLGANQGPLDQRQLGKRKDILRFVSEPLSTPLEITGKVLVELYIAGDVPDTTLMAKFIDIYPNGYEALMQDAALMARYWNGFDKPTALERGKIYKLTLELWETALVLDRGHRIGLHVSGSNAPRFEVHPNSFTAVFSYDEAPVAHIAVQTSADFPSRLILPSIAPGVSKDWDPKN